MNLFKWEFTLYLIFIINGTYLRFLNKTIKAGNIVKAQNKESVVSITVVIPNSRKTGKLTKISVENPTITVNPEAVIACPTFERETRIAS